MECGGKNLWKAISRFFFNGEKIILLNNHGNIQLIYFTNFYLAQALLVYTLQPLDQCFTRNMLQLRLIKQVNWWNLIWNEQNHLSEKTNHTFNQHIILPIINMKNATGFCLQNKNGKKLIKILFD